MNNELSKLRIAIIRRVTSDFRKQLRTAIADYMTSEGCDCCRDKEAHKIHEKELAKLLKVPKYSDGSGYNFSKYTTEKF